MSLKKKEEYDQVRLKESDNRGEFEEVEMKQGNHKQENTKKEK